MTLLVLVELLAGCVWVGGLVAIGVAAQSARRELAPAEQVAFFRTLGRSYLRVGGSALVVALVCGLALLTRGAWNSEKSAAVIDGIALLSVTAAAVVQARALTQLRSLALESAAAPQIRIVPHARRANALRAGIGFLTLIEVALAARLAHQ